MAKIPLCKEDVTADWLLETLQNNTKETVQVVTLEPVTENAGNLSDAFKAKVKLGPKEADLFIKIGLPISSPMSVFQTKYNVDVTEIQAYKKDLPELVTFEQEHTGQSGIAKMIPKMYGADINVTEGSRGFYLIMEDLSKTHDKPVQANSDLPLEQILMYLEKVARLHAVSYCYSAIKKIRYGKDKDYQLLKFVDDPAMSSGLESGLKAMVEDFSKIDDANCLMPHLERLTLETLKKAFTIANKLDDRFLIYGDFWSNNIMFTCDKSGVKFLDWQFFSSASPIIDFGFMAYLGASPDKLEVWLPQLYDAYFIVVEKTCKEFNIALPLTKQEFIRDCETLGMFAIFATTLFFYEDAKQNNLVDRLVWLGKMACKHNPSLFHGE